MVVRAIHARSIMKNRDRVSMRSNSRSIHPVIGFGLSLIILACVGCWHLLGTERNALRNDVEQDISNIAITLEQNLLKTANDLDRILKFLRSTYERAGHNLDWPSVLREPFTIDDHAVQIAIINAEGMMITSSAMLYPTAAVDLSDREHFRAHVDSKEDRLYISKPVLGRASGQWSVQFTRKLFNATGGFGGVMVISLDPKYLARAYSGLELGPRNGLLVAARDDTILSASGIFAQDLGKTFRIENIRSKNTKAATHFVNADTNGMAVTLARRDLEKIGMSVYVATPPYEFRENWLRLRDTYIAGTALFILVVLAATMTITNRQRVYEAKILHLARHDMLTDLGNRAGFHFELERVMRHPDWWKGFALHIVDLDRFKVVNDTFGHHIGDMLLNEVAVRLRGLIQPCDILARLGGDEFAIIQQIRSRDDATELSSRICASIAKPFTIELKQIFVGASVGTTISAARQTDPNDLMIQADLAMYAAKEAGRNTARMYTASMAEDASRRVAMESDLRLAIQNNELHLYFQPINSAKERRPTGAEVLLRWIHPTRGFVPPIEFIKIAEQSGLIIEIGAWVLRNACAEYVRQDLFDRLAINCSPAQFRHVDFVETVQAALRAAGMQADRLELEITESLLLENDEQITRQLEELRSLGIRISIDDFGTGYSSLSYLDRYPIDVVKIDKSFVQNIGKKKSAIAIIRSVVSIADSLNMSTIAEGVETEEQMVALRLLGCQEVQGYLLGAPKPMSYWMERAESFGKVA